MPRLAQFRAFCGFGFNHGERDRREIKPANGLVLQSPFAWLTLIFVGQLSEELLLIVPRQEKALSGKGECGHLCWLLADQGAFDQFGRQERELRILAEIGASDALFPCQRSDMDFPGTQPRPPSSRAARTGSRSGAAGRTASERRSCRSSWAWSSTA